MPKLILSKEELDDIIKDYNNGMSIMRIVKKYHHDRNTIKRIFQENNIKIRNMSEALLCSPEKKKADAAKSKYKVNTEYFSEQNSKMAYLLGFIMADGNVSKSSNRVQICLAELDSDFLEIFYKEIGGSPVAHFTINDGKQKVCRWECISAKIKQDLMKYELIPHKTGFAKIPSKLEKKYYPDFIRGYFDGDGSIWIEKSGAVGFGITSHNTEILEQIIDYFEECGVPRVKIKVDNRCNINYSFKYRKRASEKIYEILYYDENCLYMKRKFDKFKMILKK